MKNCSLSDHEFFSIKLLTEIQILCRFLKARKFDLDKTVQMWVDMLKWRKDNGVDSIIQVNMYYWFSASPLLSQETG